MRPIRPGIGAVTAAAGGRVTSSVANAVIRSARRQRTAWRPGETGKAVDRAAIDYADDAMVAHVTAVPVKTLYGVTGDLFAWLCLGTFVVLSVLVVLERRR